MQNWMTRKFTILNWFRNARGTVVLLLVLCAFVLDASAQRRAGLRHFRADTSAVVRAYTDSLDTYIIKKDSMAFRRDSAEDVSLDARLCRLFLPLTFYHSVAPVAFGADSISVGGDSLALVADRVLLAIYSKRPDLIVCTDEILKQSGSIRNDILDEPLRQELDLVDRVAPVPDVALLAPTEVMLKKPNFWTFGGDAYLQLLQNYVSDNWYKGGESNYSMVGNLTLTANYDNKSRVKFENKLEMKLGFQTSRDDTIHKFKTNNDLVRYTGKLGLQAKNRWYYTIQLLAYTQFTRGLKSNDENTYSDFMSPFNLNVGLGMDYKLDTENKRLSGSVNLSPIAFSFVYVDRKSLAGNYGVVGDHHTHEDFGSQVTVDLTWNITDQIKWKSRFYGYTTYERVQMEWENTITLNISKYISTNIFIYPRFDDAGNFDEDLGYWQFKEYCSLGFSYDF